MLKETKTVMLKHKISDMKDDTVNKSTNQSVTLDIEDTPYDVIFAAAVPAATVSIAVIIAPDAHFSHQG